MENLIQTAVIFSVLAFIGIIGMCYIIAFKVDNITTKKKDSETYKNYNLEFLDRQYGKTYEYLLWRINELKKEIENLKNRRL